MNPPKPTLVRILEGNPGKRPLNAEEPKPPEGAPDPPADLDEEAREVWEQLCPILEGMRVLTEADGLALANLCRLESRRRKAEADLSRGLFYANKQTGVAHINPAFHIVMQCEKHSMVFSFAAIWLAQGWRIDSAFILLIIKEYSF